MFLNIITPCSRPFNLKKIEESINIPKSHYRWIIVFDFESIPPLEHTPQQCEMYATKDIYSRFGNSQRNYALNLIEKGYIYFNDDDTIIHKNLWENIKDINDDVDFISFAQENKNGSQRLIAGNIKLNHIDSHNFITKYDICKNIRFNKHLYNADGIFAVEAFKKSNNHLIIQKTLSTYNYLK